MPKHVHVESADATKDAVFPGFGSANKVTVPAGILMRIVTTGFQTQGDGTNEATVTRHIIPAGGVEFSVITAQTEAGSSNILTGVDTFTVLPGDEYWYEETTGGSSTASNTEYSYVDIG